MPKRSLSRQRGARKALEDNLLTSLVWEEKILTTESKAKHLKPIADKIINRAQTDNLTNRRLIARRITQPKVLTKLFSVIGPRLRPESQGSFVRLLKTTPRFGDGAPRAMLALNLKPETKIASSKTKK